MLTELRLEQSRQLVDAQQAFAAYRQARAALARDHRGSMRWRKINGGEYLVFTLDGRETSLGKRSPETEAKTLAFVSGRAEAKRRRDSLAARVKDMRTVNMGYRLGRVPELSARIIDAIDRAGLLDGRVRIVGATALYAYEARCGVRFDSGLLATEDLDLLLDARAELQIAADHGIDIGAILKRADRSFDVHHAEYAVNDQGFEVDILRPDDGSAGLLADAPFDEIAISERGNPVFLSVPEASAMARHKRWLGHLPGRKPSKRPRDLAEAEAVEQLVKAYLPGRP